MTKPLTSEEKSVLKLALINLEVEANPALSDKYKTLDHPARTFLRETCINLLSELVQPHTTLNIERA